MEKSRGAMSDQPSEHPNTISREDLYQKVWSVPIVQLAKQLGYSYPELIKICMELEIPRPTGGYWYRLQHGGTSEQVPLPPVPSGAKTEIPLGPRLNDPLPLEPSTAPKVAVPDQAVEPSVPDMQESRPASKRKSGTSKEAPITVPKSEPPAVKVPQRVAPKFPDVVEMTREELYEHVWTTPIHLLAQALGLSDVGLAKTCVQMEVPRPGRGYWARLDAGEKLERVKMPPPSALAVRCWTFNVVLNRERREAWANSNLMTAGRGKAPVRLELPNEQHPLHDIAERHRAAIEKAKIDQEGLVHLDLQSLFRCDISPGITSKLARAVHALVTELERRGCRLARGDSEHPHLSIVQGKDRLSVSWRERIAMEEREPTTEEKRRPSWTWQLKESKPTGHLTIEVVAAGLKGTRSWTENESKPLEELLGRVVEKIAATFEGFEAQRQREAEWGRQREEREQRERELGAQREKERKEKERIANHEKKLSEIALRRRHNLGVAAQKWEDSERVLAFVDACEKRWRSESAGELSPTQAEWLAWARVEATKLGPWSEDYPRPEAVRTCDPTAMPVDGPYPEIRKLKPNEFSSAAAAPQQSQSAYSQYYGYSKY